MFASLSLAAALLVQSAAPATASRPTLLSYADAVRCAGLTQAASELEGGESREGRALFDAALYWSLAAAQAAEASRRGATAADTDQTRARILAVRQLSARNAQARATLRRCRQRTPNLG